MVIVTLNDASDGLVAVINAIDGGIRFYPEPIEAHPATPDVTGEIAFRMPTVKGPVLNSPWEYETLILLTTPANKPGWAAGLRRIREYASPFGAKSIFQAIGADTTLGGTVLSCLPKTVGALDERRVQFPGGDRWTIEMLFATRIGAA